MQASMEHLAPCPNCGDYCPKAAGANLVFPMCTRFPPQTCSICRGFSHVDTFHDYYFAQINLIAANNLIMMGSTSIDDTGMYLPDGTLTIFYISWDL